MAPEKLLDLGIGKPKYDIRDDLAFFDSIREELCKFAEMFKSPQKFAVIKNKELLGVTGTYKSALQCGYGNPKSIEEGFLVKEIKLVDDIHYYSRICPPKN